VTRKIDLKKIKKHKEPDELENLFSQFDQQLQACEDKFGVLKKTITELEMKKADEAEAEEAPEEPPLAKAPHID
jgi:septal ring factor EnvC (AmiA/AmiB activator)